MEFLQVHPNNIKELKDFLNKLDGKFDDVELGVFNKDGKKADLIAMFIEKGGRFYDEPSENTVLLLLPREHLT